MESPLFALIVYTSDYSDIKFSSDKKSISEEYVDTDLPDSSDMKVLAVVDDITSFQCYFGRDNMIKGGRVAFSLNGEGEAVSFSGQ